VLLCCDSNCSTSWLQGPVNSLEVFKVVIITIITTLVLVLVILIIVADLVVVGVVGFVLVLLYVICGPHFWCSTMRGASWITRAGFSLSCTHSYSCSRYFCS
jgi:hypothetical protein